MKAQAINKLREAMNDQIQQEALVQDFTEVLQRRGMCLDEAQEGAKALLSAIRNHPVESGLG